MDPSSLFNNYVHEGGRKNWNRSDVIIWLSGIMAFILGCVLLYLWINVSVLTTIDDESKIILSVPGKILIGSFISLLILYVGTTSLGYINNWNCS